MNIIRNLSLELYGSLSLHQQHPRELSDSTARTRKLKLKKKSRNKTNQGTADVKLNKLTQTK